MIFSCAYFLWCINTDTGRYVNWSIHLWCSIIVDASLKWLKATEFFLCFCKKFINLHILRWTMKILKKGIWEVEWMTIFRISLSIYIQESSRSWMHVYHSGELAESKFQSIARSVSHCHNQRSLHRAEFIAEDPWFTGICLEKQSKNKLGTRNESVVYMSIKNEAQTIASERARACARRVK